MVVQFAAKNTKETESFTVPYPNMLGPDDRPNLLCCNYCRFLAVCDSRTVTLENCNLLHLTTLQLYHNLKPTCRKSDHKLFRTQPHARQKDSSLANTVHEHIL